MDYQIQVIAVPVTDVDQAAAFYTQQAGFILDVDYHPAPASASSSSHHPARPAQYRSAPG
jgi:hypothetical protein